MGYCMGAYKYCTVVVRAHIYTFPECIFLWVPIIPILPYQVCLVLYTQPMCTTKMK